MIVVIAAKLFAKKDAKRKEFLLCNIDRYSLTKLPTFISTGHLSSHKPSTAQVDSKS